MTPTLYLHWTATPYDWIRPGHYHSIISGDGHRGRLYRRRRQRWRVCPSQVYHFTARRRRYGGTRFLTGTNSSQHITLDDAAARA